MGSNVVSGSATVIVLAVGIALGVAGKWAFDKWGVES